MQMRNIISIPYKANQVIHKNMNKQHFCPHMYIHVLTLCEGYMRRAESECQYNL